MKLIRKMLALPDNRGQGLRWNPAVQQVDDKLLSGVVPAEGSQQNLKLREVCLVQRYQKGNCVHESHLLCVIWGSWCDLHPVHGGEIWTSPFFSAKLYGTGKNNFGAVMQIL